MFKAPAIFPTPCFTCFNRNRPSDFLTASAPLAVLHLTFFLLLLHPLFMKFVQSTIDGAKFGTKIPPGGIV